MVYEVYVHKPDEYYTEKRCDWLGHHSYRCGNCKKFYLKVQSESDHQEECPGCRWVVKVRRGKDLW